MHCQMPPPPPGRTPGRGLVADREVVAVRSAGGADDALLGAHLDADAYLRLLRERAEELLTEGHDGAYPVSVAASWAVVGPCLYWDRHTVASTAGGS
jgi:hypothetical protein